MKNRNETIKIINTLLADNADSIASKLNLQKSYLSFREDLKLLLSKQLSGFKQRKIKNATDEYVRNVAKEIYKDAFTSSNIQKIINDYYKTNLGLIPRRSGSKIKVFSDKVLQFLSIPIKSDIKELKILIDENYISFIEKQTNETENLNDHIRTEMTVRYPQDDSEKEIFYIGESIDSYKMLYSLSVSLELDAYELDIENISSLIFRKIEELDMANLPV